MNQWEGCLWSCNWKWKLSNFLFEILIFLKRLLLVRNRLSDTPTHWVGQSAKHKSEWCCTESGWESAFANFLFVCLKEFRNACPMQQLTRRSKHGGFNNVCLEVSFFWDMTSRRLLIGSRRRRNRLSPFSRSVDTRRMHLIIRKIRKLFRKLKCFVHSYKFCMLVMVKNWLKFHPNSFVHPYGFLVKRSLFGHSFKTRRVKWAVMSHILFG